MSQFPCTKNFDRVTVREYKWMDVFVCSAESTPARRSAALCDALRVHLLPLWLFFFLLGGKGTREGDRRKSSYLFQLFFNHFLCGEHTAEQKTLHSQVCGVLSWSDHTEALKTEQTRHHLHTENIYWNQQDYLPARRGGLTNNIPLCGR